MSLSATPTAILAIRKQIANLNISDPVIVVFPGRSSADLKRGPSGEVLWHHDTAEPWCVTVLGPLEFERVRDAVKVSGEIAGIPAIVLSRAEPPPLNIAIENGKLRVTTVGA